MPGKIIAAWRSGSVDLLLSNSIFDELRRVLPRLEQRHGLTVGEVEDLVDALAIQADIIDPLPATEPQLRDVADQPVLGTLLAALATSGADYLVTGDKDLLVLSRKYPIVSPSDFWAAHAGV